MSENEKDTTNIATTEYVDGKSAWAGAAESLGCFALIGFIAFLIFKACVR